MNGPGGSRGDVDSVVRLLGEPEVRLLTLVGLGGVGKSRLARQVRVALSEAGTDVAVVELAGAAGPEAALALLADALPAVADDSAPVLLAENLEAVLPLAPALGTLLAGHPRLTVLATSRAAGGLTHEHLYRVRPLDVADGAAARELFLRHARRVAYEDGLDAHEQTVTAICRQLEGHPLALVIAARQLAALPAEALLARLREGWSLSMKGPVDLPGRHRSLGRVLDDTVTALSADARRLLGRLGVFEGRFAYPAVEHVLGAHAEEKAEEEADETLWDGVSELVAHGLLEPVPSADGSAGISFRMPGVVREYARRLLREDAGPQAAEALRGAHARHFGERVLDGHEEHGAAAETWTRRVEEELPDVRAALRFLIDTADPRALDLAAALRGHWLARGRLREGIALLGEVLALPVAGEGTARLRAREAHAVLTGAASSYAHALTALQECADDWAAAGETTTRARTLVDLGAAVFEAHGFDRAEPLYREAIDVLDAAGDHWWAARARSLLGASAAATEAHRTLARTALDEAVRGFRDLGESTWTHVPYQQLGRMLHEEGHDVQAVALLSEGLGLAQRGGDDWNASVFLNLLADVRLTRGEAALAGGHHVESLRLVERIGARPRYVWCLEGLAACLDDLGETPYAARLVGLSRAVRSRLTLDDWVEFPARAIDLSSIEWSLSRPVFEQLCAEGAELTVGDVLAEVPPLLSAKRAPGPRRERRRRHPDGLTGREAQVLRLIASGATSRAIASELFISIETVGRHISNLYRKIGVSSRAEATAHAIRSGLLEE
ncbi:LuxR C-terminal-related transcriptional regulator [Streptomyces sp. NPDC049954]|uniref:LuxR C-terminal-related transcriptional regulator n=1 Tax=Streptomyces sp. NPDC049954 TaxID=3155779 RepID=UPI00342BDB1C